MKKAFKKADYKAEIIKICRSWGNELDNLLDMDWFNVFDKSYCFYWGNGRSMTFEEVGTGRKIRINNNEI
jgi:hypothetical protein